MSSTPKVYPYRWVILLAFMLISAVVQIQWLAHAAVARPAEVFYEGQFDPSSFFNIDFSGNGFITDIRNNCLTTCYNPQTNSIHVFFFIIANTVFRATNQ